MDYSKVEKFETSPYFTASTLSHNGTEEGTSEKSDDSNVALNLFPDESTVTITIPLPPPEPSLVAVYTTHGYPLHVALEDSPCVKANLSLSKLKYY